MGRTTFFQIYSIHACIHKQDTSVPASDVWMTIAHIWWSYYDLRISTWYCSSSSSSSKCLLLPACWGTHLHLGGLTLSVLKGISNDFLKNKLIWSFWFCGTIQRQNSTSGSLLGRWDLFPLSLMKYWMSSTHWVHNPSSIKDTQFI